MEPLTVAQWRGDLGRCGRLSSSKMVNQPWEQNKSNRHNVANLDLSSTGARLRPVATKKKQQAPNPTAKKNHPHSPTLLVVL